MRFKRSIVSVLNAACGWVDAVAYRPAIVKLAARLPRWWSCQLAGLSMRLDDRWQTGYWVGDSAPPAPIGKCQACGRRAAWLVAGGSEDEDAESSDWFLRQQVYLCGWCTIAPEAPIESAAELDEALVAARNRSVAWRWS